MSVQIAEPKIADYLNGRTQKWAMTHWAFLKSSYSTISVIVLYILPMSSVINSLIKHSVFRYMGSIKHMLASKPKKIFILGTSCLILLESSLFLVSEYLCFVYLCPQIKKLWMFELMVSTFYQNETSAFIFAI